MTVIAPRIVQIAVGVAGAVGREWDQRFYIKGTVTRTAGKTPNKAKVEIYNLSPASLQFLETPNMVLQVRAGETIPGTLFYGDIEKTGVRTKVMHPNQVTTITATDGGRIFQDAYFTGSYPAGTTRTQILTDALAANAIATGHIATLPERVYQAATGYSAPLPDVLDELYAGEPAAWSIQRNAFTLLHDDLPAPGNAPVISVPTGMIGSPERTDKGVKAETNQLGAFAPGTPFVIKSRLVNGTFKTSKVVDAFDTELEWAAKLTGTVLP
jgi:hypothetical protein